MSIDSALLRGKGERGRNLLNLCIITVLDLTISRYLDCIVILLPGVYFRLVDNWFCVFFCLFCRVVDPGHPHHPITSSFFESCRRTGYGKINYNLDLLTFSKSIVLGTYRTSPSQLSWLQSRIWFHRLLLKSLTLHPALAMLSPLLLWGGLIVSCMRHFFALLTTLRKSKGSRASTPFSSSPVTSAHRNSPLITHSPIAIRSPYKASWTNLWEESGYQPC